MECTSVVAPLKLQPCLGSTEVDGPNAEIIRRAKLKHSSDIPYLKSKTTKQKTYLPMQ